MKAGALASWSEGIAMNIQGPDYLFIDGRYLHTLVERTFEPLFHAVPRIDYTKPKLLASAGKVFYYDCLADVKKPAESESDFKVRLTTQNDELNAIRSLPGFHVRLGTLSGEGKRLRQKEVDVQLAVDMLTHASAKNMARATLIAGDLDFRPVVNSLIQLGTYVRVWYGSHAAADELRWSADESNEIRIDELYRWTTEASQNEHRLPARNRRPKTDADAGMMPIKFGKLAGRTAILYDHAINQEGPFYILISDRQAADPLWISHPDRAVLEKYVNLSEGAIRWEGTPCKS
jgi:uncharacterized LabA/DUF88 family protein